MEIDNGNTLQAHVYGPNANLYEVDRDGMVVGAFRKESKWISRTVPPVHSATVPDTFQEFHSRWEPVNRSVNQALKSALRVFDRTLVLEVMCRAGVAPSRASSCSDSDLGALFRSAKKVHSELYLPNPRIYTDTNTFSLIPLELYRAKPVEEYASVDEAVKIWSKRALARAALASIREPLKKSLRQAVNKSRRRSARLTQEMSRESKEATYEHYGHLLMATPPRPAGATSVALTDIIGNGSPVKIPLLDRLNTIENAQRYYEKARKVRTSRKMLAKRVEDSESRTLRLENLLEKVCSADTVASVRRHQVSAKALLGGAQKLNAQRRPYRRYILDSGYEAWVGKNARDSDKLTMSHARPYDLWMHARGMTGAHVVLRMPQRNSSPNSEVVRVAAALAAYHSKARGSALVPVIVTPRKYVRKRKGMPPGKVIIDREEVIMVEPAPMEE